MKFKVESRDFILFVVYSVILLYLCCIFVLNFYSFTHDGTFYGLLPFKAFTMPFLPVTFILFGAVMAFIFTNVSSYIFSKDKEGGFGLKFKDKATDGFSRWSTIKEIKKSKGATKVDPKSDTLEAAGIPLINNKKEMWVDNSDYHTLVLGSTGSGKSESIVKPLTNLLAKKGESMIITDPKGELYRECGNMLKDRGYNIILLNFRDTQNGNAWNPLNLPYKYYKKGNKDKATELLDDVALNILYDPSSKSDSDFWEKSAADYFSGLSLGLFEDAEEKEVNLNSINYMSTVGEERYATSNYIKEYFTLKGEDSSPYIFASNTINAPTETKGGILSTFRQKIRLFSSRELLSEMLAYSDFDMADIGKKKTAVFLLIHDEKKTYHSLMTIFIKQCYETLIDVAQENGGKLAYRTNFILDEFANMPPLKDVDSMVSAARSRDIRFTFIIQNFAQLNDVYGQEVAQVIRGNCGNLVYLISTEMAALKEISEMCGEIKVKTGKGDSEKEENRPLISVTDLQKLKMGELILIRLRLNPFKTKFEPNFKIDWGLKQSIADFPTRKQEEIHLFDLKKFVTEAKNKKMQESGQGMGMNPGMPGMSPFGMPSSSPFGPMNSNPFGSSPMGSPMSSSSFGSSPMGGSMSSSPFGPMSKQSANPFGEPSSGNLNNMDIEAMMKDIDQKIKELEEEERKEQEAEEKKKAQAKNKQTKSEFDIEDTKEIPKVKKEVEEPVKISKKEPEEDVELLFDNVDDAPNGGPVVNVDKDSVVVKENVVSDDEFFDDFFDDNE
jgi:type IV secretion system protein VirD4